MLATRLYATEMTPHTSETSLVENQPHEVYLTNKILLQALDKVTGHVITLEAEMNQAIQFGTLYITPRLCQKASPEDPPESTAFLEIVEIKSNAQERLIFQGWMFASYPSISALEHTVYDVWVKECSGSMIKPEKRISSPLITNKPPLSEEMEAFYQGLGETPETN